MPLFRRKPKSVERVPPPSELQPGETVERSLKASLLYGKDKIAGSLFMTNRRLMFEAAAGKRSVGEARWMVVPYDEVREVGLHRWHHTPMGRSSLNQCLCIVTTKGEQVWWDFAEHEEREWLLLVEAHVAAASPIPIED
jgi:hypothetical protein